MNRTYTRKEYLELVEKIRCRIPEVALTTDIIVGFPTETEVDFGETAEVIEQVGFDNAFIFKYSERKGTIAARKYPDDIPPDTKKDRIVRLLDVQRRISLGKNSEKIGKKVTVLIEGEADKRPDYQIGKSNGGTTVIFPAIPFGPGSLVSIDIREASSCTLYGVAV
jgi:tRNA-2-methylthio-N6-dimethylallyladenosine synthase